MPLTIQHHAQVGRWRRLQALGAQAPLAQQRQIDYTRSSESEADRIGIQTLSRGGYNVDAMAGFFATLQARSRSNAADWYGETPEYLRTHPVTKISTRCSLSSHSSRNTQTDARLLQQAYESSQLADAVV